MTLGDYWEILLRSWRIVAASTAIAILAALGLSMMATPVYQAQSQLFVSVQSADEISGAYTGGLYVQQRIKSYETVVDTPSVLDPVIAKLSLDTDSTQLASSVSAQNPTNTVLLDVMASDVDAKQAMRIADATAESLAAEIVRLETTASGAKPVKVELIRPAELPGSPISPRTRLNLMLGALLGFAVGMGIAVLRTTLDTSIKSIDDLHQATQATVLGSVTYDADAADNPLVSLQSSPRAEAYRSIRTNLQYVDVDNPPRSVVITSAVPMEGKSTAAVNLAIALAQSDAKVLLIEADLRRPRVAEYLDVEGSVGLTDVLSGQAGVDEAIISWRRGLLDFLPAGAIPPNPSELLGSKHLADLLTEMAARYDTIIVDAPPLLPVTDAAILATAADGAILVVRYGQTTHEQAEQATDSLRHVNARLLGAVLNFVPDKRRPQGYGYGDTPITTRSPDTVRTVTPQRAAAPQPPRL